METMHTKDPNFGWHYPPGATGSEPQIGGWPPCARCGHDEDEHSRGRVGAKDGDQCLVIVAMDNCRCHGYTDEPEGPDPDCAYDERRERERGL